jgi:DNA-binding Lrp family transcriptional regulator
LSRIISGISISLIFLCNKDKKLSMKNLTTPELSIARLIQGDIPLISRPFERLASLCNQKENDVLDAIKTLMQKGFIRRFGAIIRHQKIGFSKNALIVWAIPPDRMEKAGEKMASFDFISHCYLREPAFREKYNLFTMLHSKEGDITSLVKEIAESLCINDYLILESMREYKKTSPEYFS